MQDWNRSRRSMRSPFLFAQGCIILLLAHYHFQLTYVTVYEIRTVLTHMLYQSTIAFSNPIPLPASEAMKSRILWI